LKIFFESVAISATVAKLLSSQMVTKWQISGKMANKTRINNILTLS
jgi:hypothetical protein